MPTLELSFASGEDSLRVSRFSVHEAVSSLFTVSVWARSRSPSLDLEALVGKPATFHVDGGVRGDHRVARTWTGVCGYIEQVHAVPSSAGQEAESGYYLRIVPDLWLLTHRRNYRIFQHLSIPDITDRLLGEWAIQPVWNIDRGDYPKLEYKVQYGESDYAFLCRLWEEAGIAFTFPDADPAGPRLTLSDKLDRNPLRAGDPLPYVDNPSQTPDKEFVSNVRLSREVRPGAATFRDYDFRNPGFPLFGNAPKAPAPEDSYEQYHYRPGAFLIETGKGGRTPAADDKGVARHDQPFGDARAARALGGDRLGRRAVAFDTNAIDLWPGVVVSMEHHPHAELAEGTRLLITEFTVDGAPGEEWPMSAQAVFTDVVYRPAQRTPKPTVEGIQSATVVGPQGTEIHTDEFGRVRVQFPWDREGRGDDNSSCWIRVHQGWGGAGWGMITVPRIGQEVLVSFLQGNPDQPVVIGRAYNAVEQVPYKLPEHRTRSTWKSDSSPGSGGFNEIMFEDRKGAELVWQQAEKDRRRLVKNDERATVVHDRQKLVKNDESEETGGSRQRWVGKEEDLVTKAHRRERIEGDDHLEVRGSRREVIAGKQSLTVVQDRQDEVGGRYAVRAEKAMHHVGGEAYVGEGAEEVTLRGPGGFIRIDGSGVTIKGTLVKINVSGSPGKGKGAKPEPPDELKG
ncbi:type VI secretion system tip protein TssI/VgrG [Sorangium sp. So ce185]|uniref:type VI secretion system Vgr family protein n=1 Tax=Sorangium sp. So ce185 TaxID=3133287 RepID=UPI003F60D3E2